MTGEAMHDMQFMYEHESELRYFSADALSAWEKGDTDEIYSFKVVRAARYEAALRRIKSLESALRSISPISCGMLHHKLGERHECNQECPPLLLIKNLLNATSVDGGADGG